MAEYKGFPVNDGKIIIDFSDNELIKNSILQCSNYNTFDCFINAIISVYLKIKCKKILGSKIYMELSKEDIYNINNKYGDPTSDPIYVKIKIIDSLIETDLEIKIKDYINSPSECFKLIENYDIDLTRRGKVRKLTIHDSDGADFTQSSESLTGSILGAYFQLINRKAPNKTVV